LAQNNKEILSTTSTDGETNFIVCNKEEGKEEKVCKSIDAEKTAVPQSKPMPSSMDNNTYNLLEQLTVENKSLWRIRNNYKNDASMDNVSKQIWSRLEKEKEENVKLLSERLKQRL
jgi:hypothetical protein